MTDWNVILTKAELAQHWADCAKLDPSFARCARLWWENATVNTLHAQRHGAWLCNERETYCLARSYLALRGALTNAA